MKIKIKIDKRVSVKAIRVMQVMPQRMNQAIKIALFKSGTELQDRAVNLAPYKSGTLRRSIGLKATSKKAIVGTALVYARIHDQGGVIRPVRAKALRFKINGQWIVTRKVVMPKYKGRGFLTPAFNWMVGGRAKWILDSEILKIAL